MNGFHDLQIRECVTDDVYLGWLDGIPLICSVVQRESFTSLMRSSVSCRWVTATGLDERRDFVSSSRLLGSYDVAGSMGHAHDETQSITARIDGALHIRKTGCSAEFDTHQNLSVVMAE